MTTKLQENLSSGYEVKIGDYLSRGFDIFKANAGGYIGYTVLYFLISFIVNLIPFINFFTSLLIGPCLIFGFYLVSKSIVVDKVAPPFGDFFKGFDYFGKLVVVAILSAIGYMLCAIPLIVTVGVSALALEGADSKEIFDTLLGGPLFVTILTVCAFVYLSVSWIFASLIAVFHDMSAWEALETSRKLVAKNWFMIFIFLFVVGIIVVAGMIAFLIGLVFTVPLGFCYLFAAFEDIVGIPGLETNELEIAGIGEGLT